MSYHFHVRLRSMPADTLTPVSVYLKMRDIFPGSLLLESSDYTGHENSYSYVCCKPVAGIELCGGQTVRHFPDGTLLKENPGREGGREALSSFVRSFSFEDTGKEFCNGRFFGHINYDAVTYFEKINFRERSGIPATPEARLHIYRYVIVFDHFNHTVYLAVHDTEKDGPTDDAKITAALRNPHTTTFPFDTTGEEKADTTEEEYLDMVASGKKHCRQGDVFQVVLSRSFAQQFKGDDFNVYRALRMVNPSPYLFYFDYGNYRLFGSSPETQLKISKGLAIMHPIAGTCRRSGHEEEDDRLIRKLMDDPKENAEHIMLVDLARNDLSKSHDKVEVTAFKQVQRFSHVAHIVSEVQATQPQHQDAIGMLADTFPAGTLSGAPKYKAMQLIDQYEKSGRGYYGGTIGFLAPDGTMNQAIMIRSFMSCNNMLYFRAGAGIVDASDPRHELQEVEDKLKGLRMAIVRAKETGTH